MLLSTISKKFMTYTNNGSWLCHLHPSLSWMAIRPPKIFWQSSMKSAVEHNINCQFFKKKRALWIICSYFCVSKFTYFENFSHFKFEMHTNTHTFSFRKSIVWDKYLLNNIENYTYRHIHNNTYSFHPI